MSLRYGVIGAGGAIAPAHLVAIGALEGAELVALADPRPRRAAERAARLGARYVADNDELLAMDLDVVVVCAPHRLHAPLALDALRAGSHVLVEKPLSLDVAQADAVARESQQRGLACGVCLQQRFSDVVRRARAFARAELGKLKLLSVVHPDLRNASYYREAPWRGTWAGEGGAVLVNQAPHVLDLVCHLAGAPPARARGWLRRRTHAIEAHDTADAFLEWPDGAVGHVHLATDETGPSRIELLGDRGRIELVRRGPDAGEETLVLARFATPIAEHIGRAGPYDRPEETVVASGAGHHQGSHADLHEDFAAAVRDGREPACSAREALASIELMDAIFLAGLERRPVDLPVDREAARAAFARLANGGG